MKLLQKKMLFKICLEINKIKCTIILEAKILSFSKHIRKQVMISLMILSKFALIVIQINDLLHMKH